MIRLLLHLAAMALAGTALALDSPPLVRSWQAEHGLPSNTIRWITQTPDGYMWLGTEAGLTRFDGARFVTFGPRDGIPAIAIDALAATPDGALWVAGGDMGIVRLKENTFTTFTTAHGLPSNRVHALSVGHDGTLWVGTSGGVCRWKGNQFAVLPKRSGNNNAITLLARRNGEVWVLFGGRALEVWNGQSWTPAPKLPRGGPDGAPGLKEDPEGRVWTVTNEGPAVRLGPSGWEEFPFQPPPATSLPRPMAIGPNGEVCIGHLGAGLWVLKGNAFVPLSANDGSGEALVEGVHYDRDGQLWVGSFSSGLVRVSPRRLDSLRLDPRNNADPVRSIVETQPGKLWAGTQGIGIWKWENGKPERIVPHPSMESEIYGNSLARNRAGSIFVGTDIVRQFDGNTLTSAFNLIKPQRETVRSLVLAPDDTLHVGTANGRILKLQGGTLKLLAPGNGCGTIWSLAFTPDESLWASTTEKGIRRFLAGKETFYTTADGLRSNRINALHVDTQGTLWAAPRGGGLARWNGTTFRSIGTEAGLFDDNITQIIDDAQGKLWLGGTRGLSSLPIMELDAALTGAASTVHPRNFGRADGMDSSEFLEMRPIRGEGDLLYFGTTRGIVRVDSRAPANEQSSPRVYLESLTADDHQQFFAADSHWPAQAQLPPGVLRVEIGFTAPEFVAPEQLRFRYRMSGVDEQWHALRGQRSVSFNRLPPGRYQLEVSTAAPGGEWAAPAALQITLLPYFWQTRWFLAMCSFLALLLIGGLIWDLTRRRAARAMARLERQHALDAERARIAKDLHDDLGANLTEIALFSDLAKSDLGSPTQAAEHLEHIFVTARNSARSLDEIIWATNPARDSLESFIAYLSKQVQDLARASGLSCHLSLPETLPSGVLPSAVRHHLFLAAREALHNVAKHAQAQNVGLTVLLDETNFTLVIEDDGRGLAEGENAEDADGIRNMTRRMSEIGGSFAMGRATERGTRVTLRVPISVIGQDKEP